jgi:histidinol dehydrogenase
VFLKSLSAARDAAAVDALTRRNAVIPLDVDQKARAIVEDVRARGDVAVREYTERFEKRTLAALEIDAARWDAEAAKVSPAIIAALEHAAANVTRFHERQREQSFEIVQPGVRMGLRIEPLARVGLYVPGGTARYPSSVIMTAVPARVAGVREVVMVTPGASPETLAAARVAGVDRVFEIGGAHAVAALAYGTESVPRVDKIVGPGNVWVAAAKRLVFGDVDIDSVAGPSEVLVIADDSADAALVASDLLAQAEHDTDAHAVLLTTSAALVAQVEAELARQLADLPRRAIAEKALLQNGAAVVTDDLGQAVRLANKFAPEHLELHVREAAKVSESIRTAGAIFVGAWTPEAAGDYLAGPNHVLPTGGAARYASPLGVYDYVKRTTVLEYQPEGLAAHADDIQRLAEVEGLHAHGRSVRIRLERAGKLPEKP